MVNGIQVKRATSRSLPIALLRARERVMGPIRAILADSDVTEQQWRVLRILEEEGTTDATFIAKSACLLMPSLTRILQVLENKDFCTREPHPTDRRKTLIKITDKGLELIYQNAPSADEALDDLQATFGAERLDQIACIIS